MIWKIEKIGLMLLMTKEIEFIDEHYLEKPEAEKKFQEGAQGFY